MVDYQQIKFLCQLVNREVAKFLQRTLLPANLNLRMDF
jgi:hypothetical protein